MKRGARSGLKLNRSCAYSIKDNKPDALRHARSTYIPAPNVAEHRFAILPSRILRSVRIGARSTVVGGPVSIPGLPCNGVSVTVDGEGDVDDDDASEDNESR